LIEPKTTSQEQAERIKEAAGLPLTVAFECTGVQSSIHTAIYVRCLLLLQFLFIVECTRPVRGLWWKGLHYRGWQE
jgi:hypothetical protein